jgi:peptidyl-dipeptidase A
MSISRSKAMKNVVWGALIFSLMIGPWGRGEAAAQGRDPDRSRPVNRAGEKKETDVKAEAEAFLRKYQREFAKLEVKANLASWAAATTGKKEDFDAYAAAELALREFHSDPVAYRKIRSLLEQKSQLPPLDARALKVAELAFEANQLPPETLSAMVKLSTEIERIFKTFRAELGGKRLSNNDLLEMLRQETDSQKRKATWEALKQVGGAVGPKLVELARLRNRAAAKLGYRNYWEMQIRLQEYEPAQLLALFAELQRLTEEPFKRMKEQLDREVAARLKIEPGRVMPWDYDNPFFQAAPPSDKVDLDEFYRDKTKQDIVAIAEKFYADIGLPIRAIIARSDLYEREGKDQHAFCIDINRDGDVRTLLNIKPTEEWMDTTLHEEGHAVYELHIDPALPYNLREPAQAFTTEGVAMLFGALAKNPTWMIAYAGADPKRVDALAGAIYEQRRREQLIFARWALVMFHFERALYENPDQDLNKLWWDDKERFQGLRRPPDRNEPDWAAKPHFTIAPVYYQNYMLGELFAAQLRHMLAESVGYTGPSVKLSFNGRQQFGTLLKNRVFWPGDSLPWPEFVQHATGEELTPRYFAAEVR